MNRSLFDPFRTQKPVSSCACLEPSLGGYKYCTRSSYPASPTHGVQAIFTPH